MTPRSNLRYLPTSALGCLLLFAFSSCAQNLETVAITIKAVPDTVTLIRNPDAAFFRISAIMRNVANRPLVVADCGPSAQRAINGEWVTIFMPVCLGSAQWVLSPGDSAVIPALVYGYTAPNTEPHLDPRMVAGRYRLLFGIALADRSRGVTDLLPIDRRTSSVFFVKEGP